LFGVLLIAQAFAFSADDALEDPALEERAKDLHDGLRCMVCNGQAISDSNAELARDMRLIVREKIAAGQSDEQIVKFLTDRYGDYVLLSPPVKPANYVLWFGPVAVLLIGGASIYFLFRRRRAHGALEAGPVENTKALSPEERRTLDRLLDDDR
jgi:cytochrome c-type biogenesis protein CcmH